jgi:ATP-dependent DNA helicase RecQ
MSFQQISEILRSWPDAVMPATPFSDGPCERVRLALRAFLDGSSPVGSADLASLIRYVARCEAAKFHDFPRLQVPCVHPWPDRDAWRAHGCFVSDAPRPGFCTIEALEWLPVWLEKKSQWPPFQAAEEGKLRRQPRLIPADPAVRERFSSEHFKFDHYLSPAQADAVRGVALSLPGSVTVVALPTGAGKSWVGLSAALLGSAGGVSVVVVPTIALAYDQTFKAREVFPGVPIDAWRGELKPEERDAIRQRIRSGQQRIIYAAPESVIGALASALYDAAHQGLLRAFIVDEAHLVAQWGDGFRPDFQAMSGLWQQLRQTSPPDRAFRTVLMTATLTEESYRTLHTFFGPADQIETLASVHLRTEPDYFIAECQSPAEPNRPTIADDSRGEPLGEKRRRLPDQVASVLEVLRWGPRPAILYVTHPHEARIWHERLQREQWLRVGCIHGKVAGSARERAIDLWRSNQLDVMVATSAFGLGMDKGDVRLVIHACVPETVDRFYQEVGRGGRDGCPSVSVLLWTQKDCKDAEGISGPKIIGEELGLERWNAIRHDSEWDGETMLANLRAMRPGVVWDSDANMGWNLKTLLLLARAGALTIESRRPPTVTSEQGETEAAFEKRLADKMEEHWSLCPVRLHAAVELSTPEYWATVVASSRIETLSAASLNWRRMREVLEGRRDLNRILRDVYRVPEAGIEVGDGNEGLPVRPPFRLCARLSDALRQIIPPCGLPLLIVTYTATRDWQREVLRAVERLVRLGIRELAAPDAWRSGSGPLQNLHRSAPERFVLVRGIFETDPHGSSGWPLPRLTVVEPTPTLAPISEHLLLLERPFHLIFVPVGTPDARHLGWTIGDVSPPNTMRWDTLENLLQL